MNAKIAEVVSSEQHHGLTTLRLLGPWDSGLLDMYRDNACEALELNTSYGFMGDDLKFLEALPGLRGLMLIGTFENFQGLESSFPSLEILNFSVNSRQPVDFSRMTSLRKLFLFNGPRRSGFLDHPRLESLYVYKYAMEDLEPIRAPFLTSLRLGPAAKLISLSGLDKVIARQLLELGVYRAPRLLNLTGLSSMRLLKVLEFDSCRKLGRLDEVGSLEHLQRFQLSDCGVVSSLKPLISSLASLEEVIAYGDTDVEDGELGFLARAPRLRTLALRTRRHYLGLPSL